MTDIDTQIFRIHYNGIIDVKKLFDAVQSWFSKENFSTLEDVYKFKEATFGHDIEEEITGTKKVNEFIKYEIKVKIVIRDAEFVEVVENGVKKSARRGGAVIEITPRLLTDWQKSLQKGRLGRLKHSLYAYVLKPKIEDHWDTLYYKGISLQKAIKGALNMST